MRRAVIRMVALPAIGIAFGSLGLLGLLIGWEGASRAYSVGLHTLFRDHLLAVTVVLVATGLLAGLVGRTLASPQDLWLTIGFVIAADVAAALLVTLVIDEMRRFPDLPRAMLTETAGGLQILAAAIGAVVGYAAARTRGPLPDPSA